MPNPSCVPQKPLKEYKGRTVEHIAIKDMEAWEDLLSILAGTYPHGLDNYDYVQLLEAADPKRVSDMIKEGG